MYNYTQRELDDLDCHCKHGRSRCCLALGVFARRRRIGWRKKGFDPGYLSAALAVKYFVRACALNRAVGCLWAILYHIKKKTIDYNAVLQRSKAECLAGFLHACDMALNMMEVGLGTFAASKDERRRLAYQGCRLGAPSTCLYLGDELSLNQRARRKYAIRSCELGPADPIKERHCSLSAQELFGMRYPKTDFYDMQKVYANPMFAKVAFDPLVIYCSIRYEKPELCNRVLDLCRKRSFLSSKKRKYCPLLEKVARKYLQAKTVGKKWPPDLVRKGYRKPTCSKKASF